MYVEIIKNREYSAVQVFRLRLKSMPGNQTKTLSKPPNEACIKQSQSLNVFVEKRFDILYSIQAYGWKLA